MQLSRSTCTEHSPLWQVSGLKSYKRRKGGLIFFQRFNLGSFKFIRRYFSICILDFGHCLHFNIYCETILKETLRNKFEWIFDKWHWAKYFADSQHLSSGNLRHLGWGVVILFSFLSYFLNTLFIANTIIITIHNFDNHDHTSWQLLQRSSPGGRQPQSYLWSWADSSEEWNCVADQREPGIVMILHHDPSSGSNIRILHHDPTSWSHIRIPHHDPTSWSHIRIQHQDPTSWFYIKSWIIAGCSKLFD